MLDVLTARTGPSSHPARTLSGEHRVRAVLETGLDGTEMLWRDRLKLLEHGRIAYRLHDRLTMVDVVVWRVLRGTVVVSCHVRNQRVGRWECH